MPLLTPFKVPRSKVAADNPILWDDGRAAQGFYHPGHVYFGWERIPYNNLWSDSTPSFMAPMSHYHLLQHEKFHVKSGAGYWYLRNKRIKLVAGENLTIPMYVAHRFESIPTEDQEPLVIEYRYDKQWFAMEERFFRNTLTYLWDCRRAGVEPSVCQLCLFLADCWMPPELVVLPKTWGLRVEYLGCFINAVLMWVFAAIGLVVYGYSRTYKEYYDPEVSQKLIEQESKKEQ